jgi:RES domain-containing protein
MILWRIAAETRKRAADDLSGAGAARYPGRWNAEGQAAVYAASTIALAMLETAAHIDDAGLPLDRYLVRIEVPDRVWQRRTVMAVTDLPVAWGSVPAGRASVQFGERWLKALHGALLVVPSAIVPEEAAVLINPLHPDARALRAHTVRRIDYGSLFR